VKNPMSMEYVHAAILLHKAGKPINDESLTQVLTAAGITADPVRVKALVASLVEVNIDEALKSATTFAPVAAAPAAAPAAGAKPAAAGEDKKKKEEEEKKKEEAAIEGLGALFG
jgi:large subunit ribosomal protein L12